MIKEDLLHYLWKTKKFNLKSLYTEEGDPLEILNFGFHNKDSGPDFLNAQLKISKTHWVGNVEMHVYASDWKKHKHDMDPAYNNVILHVVFENDFSIKRKDGSIIPTLVLKKRIPPGLSKSYLKLLHTQEWIPCQNQIHSVDESLKILWYESLSIERLRNMTHYFKTQLASNKNDWEQTFYQLLSRSFGLKVNSLAFERLAHSIPLKRIKKVKDNPLHIEALLFGQAGFLDFNPKDQYPKSLKREYKFMVKKWGLKPIPKNLWKFMRMRPVNFPTIRIAQLASLLYKKPCLFSSILDLRDINQLRLFFVSDIAPYWDNHFLFDKSSSFHMKRIGETMIDLIIINLISPFIFLYGQETGNEILKERALKYLEELKPEKNKIVRGWSKINIKAISAKHSQALLQLKSEYCNHKRCLDCRIGHSILKNQ
jgi:hypothetical protein